MRRSGLEPLLADVQRRDADVSASVGVDWSRAALKLSLVKQPTLLVFTGRGSGGGCLRSTEGLEGIKMNKGAPVSLGLACTKLVFKCSLIYIYIPFHPL